MLLKQGAISEASTDIRDVKKYSEIRLINAMMDINDSEGIPFKDVYLFLIGINIDINVFC
jgi:hypothetical protein